MKGQNQRVKVRTKGHAGPEAFPGAVPLGGRMPLLCQVPSTGSFPLKSQQGSLPRRSCHHSGLAALSLGTARSYTIDPFPEAEVVA